MTWPLFDDLALDAVVTTRQGGVSSGSYASLNLALHVGDQECAVLENRRRALAALDATFDELVVANQVHGATVTVVGPGDAGRGARALADAIDASDAMVTRSPDIVLAILVADCAPVVLVDPEARLLGCAHAGWRGALGGVLEATIDSMTSIGADRSRLYAGLGPTVGPTAYEVGPEVAEAATRRLGDATRWLTAGRQGHWWFDLPGAVHEILRRAGIAEERIAASELDTGAQGPFYSARAQARCGRFAVLARLVP
ncbi:MAG: peptidoglycan editing factor PgeF [Acidimicrobiales bacterium]